MDITYQNYTLSRVSSKSLTFNLIKKVTRINQTTKETYQGKKTLGSMSFERCIETIINDLIFEGQDTITLENYFQEYKTQLNNLNAKNNLTQ